MGVIIFCNFFHETNIQFKRVLKQNNNDIYNDHLYRLPGKPVVHWTMYFNMN